MISKETIDEVIMRNDISSLIGSYVTLKRAGSNMKGLCPFHNEKTPSFVVYPADNSFYCFGCGVGGTAITFVQHMEHLDYPDAIEFLAKRAGITVIKDTDADFRPSGGIKKDRLLKMNVDAARFFHKMLFDSHPKAQECLKYFTEKRGLSQATIKHFGLGYAPDSYDALIKYMTAKGYTRDELVEGFFAVKSDKGGGRVNYFDNFRNRAMFPIIDAVGNVIAFGGRVLDDSKPKYRNTMDTVVYKKSRNLFALNFAKQVCQESVILCEGYLDVISLHQAGFGNAIASLGTAITSEQARLISRYTKKVFICYDSDEAGQKATQRAIKILGEAGLETVVIQIPGEKDPDDYIKAHGKEKFAEVLGGAKSKFEYNMSTILSRYDINLSQDRINALIELEKLISSVYSKAERDIYIQAVSERLKVDSRSIKDDVERLVHKNLGKQKKSESDRVKQEALGYSDRVNPDFAKAPSVARNEENVLGLMLVFPEHGKAVVDGELLTDDDFFTEFNKRVFAYAKALTLGTAEEINSLFTADEVSRIAKMRTTYIGMPQCADSSVLDESISMLRDSMEKKKAEKIDTIDELQRLIESKRNN